MIKDFLCEQSRRLILTGNKAFGFHPDAFPPIFPAVLLILCGPPHSPRQMIGSSSDSDPPGGFASRPPRAWTRLGVCGRCVTGLGGRSAQGCHSPPAHPICDDWSLHRNLFISKNGCMLAVKSIYGCSFISTLADISMLADKTGVWLLFLRLLFCDIR